MLFPEHNNSGRLVIPLSLDASTELYPRLELASSPEEILAANRVFKAALEEGEFSWGHKKLFAAFKRAALKNLPEDTAQRATSWLWYSCTRRNFNPDYLWTSILNEFYYSRNGWPNVGQSQQEQSKIDEFCELFISEWDNEGFSELVSSIEDEYKLTDWDMMVHMKYELIYFGEAMSPFVTLKGVNRVRSFRRSIRLFDFPSRPDFPHEKLLAIGRIWIKENFSQPQPLHSLLEFE